MPRDNPSSQRRTKENSGMTERQKRIEAELDKADGKPRKKATPPPAKNQYPAGSARSKLWARKQAKKPPK